MCFIKLQVIFLNRGNNSLKTLELLSRFTQIFV